MNNLSESEIERLAILIEEAAEVQQVATKILRHGYGSHNPFDESKTPNRELLNKELGDLLFAFSLMVDCHDVSSNSIYAHKSNKAEKINQYLHHNTSFTPNVSEDK
jgi:NTP pyrophosphatase (non-canonical NTP hydrolase)